MVCPSVGQSRWAVDKGGHARDRELNLAVLRRVHESLMNQIALVGPTDCNFLPSRRAISPLALGPSPSSAIAVKCSALYWGGGESTDSWKKACVQRLAADGHANFCICQIDGGPRVSPRCLAELLKKIRIARRRCQDEIGCRL